MTVHCCVHHHQVKLTQSKEVCARNVNDVLAKLLESQNFIHVSDSGVKDNEADTKTKSNPPPCPQVQARHWTSE